MNIYLAGAYHRQRELAIYAAALEQIGHTVTSRWLKSASCGDAMLDDTGKRKAAMEDVEDIMCSMAMILFTDDPHGSHTTGGHHTEAGMALLLDMPLLIVGPRENVFHFTSVTIPRFEMDAVRDWIAVKGALMERAFGSPGAAGVMLGAITHAMHQAAHEVTIDEDIFSDGGGVAQ